MGIARLLGFSNILRADAIMNAQRCLPLSVDSLASFTVTSYYNDRPTCCRICSGHRPKSRTGRQRAFGSVREPDDTPCTNVIRLNPKPRGPPTTSIAQSRLDRVMVPLVVSASSPQFDLTEDAPTYVRRSLTTLTPRTSLRPLEGTPK